MLLLSSFGAILFKDFNVDSAPQLRKFAKAISPEILDYVDRAAPRIRLAEKVYTSTEYPNELWIPLHHEMSYSHIWPGHLYFCCMQPASVGGFTPIASDHLIYEKIPVEIKSEFEAKGLMYIRNYMDGIDMTWQEAFQSDNRLEVEAIFQNARVELQWINENHLRTTLKKPATINHPVTNKVSWFNHAHLFHKSNVDTELYRLILENYGQENLPRNVLFADGSEIGTDMIKEIRELYMSDAVAFHWKKGDALLVDNISTVHGRSPFEGDRSIGVAMTDLHKLENN